MFNVFIKCGVGVVLNPGILTRVMRAAARDHAGRDFIADAQAELRYARDFPRDDNYGASPAEMWREQRKESGWYCPRNRGGWPTITVHAVEIYDEPITSGVSAGAVGTVDVCYDTDRGFARALYGVYEDGRVVLWMN